MDPGRGPPGTGWVSGSIGRRVVEFAGPAAFVGRAPELARVEAAFRRVRDGRSATIVVGGEAGVGKSRLIEHALSGPATAGATVLTGACLEFGEAAVPYAPLVAAFRDLGRSMEPSALAAILGHGRAELGRLIPELASRDTSASAASHDHAEPERTARARLFEAVVGVAERLTRRGPVVLVIEDLQWADAATRDLLRYLVGGLRRAPLLTLLSVRTDDLSGEHPILEWLAELERDGAERLELGPLDRAEVEGLAEALLDGPISRSVAERLHARTDGNPFFVEALVARALAAADGATPQDALLAVLDAPLPPALRDILAARIVEQEGAAAEVVRAASLAGLRLDDTLLAAVLHRPVRTVAAALREATERGILVARRGRDGIEGYAFRHTLVREVVRDELGPGERRELHAAFARVLEATTTVPKPAAAELAGHWDAAGDARRALPAFVEAARAAERVFAFDEVRRAARRALELWPIVEDPERHVPVDQVGLLDRCAHAAALLGDHVPALADAREAMRLAEAAGDRHRVVLLHERLRWILWEQGDRSAALAEVATAIAAPARRAAQRPAGEGLRAPRRPADVRRRPRGVQGRGRGGHRDRPGGPCRPRRRSAWGSSAGTWRSRATWTRGLRRSGTRSPSPRSSRASRGSACGAPNLAALLDRIGRPTESLQACLDGLAMARRLGVERSYGGQLRGSAAKALFALGRWTRPSGSPTKGWTWILRGGRRSGSM